MSVSNRDDRQRDERLEDLFHDALEQPAGQRRAWLAAVAGDDPRLVAEVVSLLEAHAEAPDCLEHPAWAPGDEVLAVDPPVPTALPQLRRIGPYVLRRLLGEGGMGSVYLADQKGPLRRPVAIKLIKLGMDTAEVVARFDSERQALALLNHPHIAAVHDAGVTSRGRPYFVMEYVPGKRITEYCDEHKLDLRERLRIFLAVCDAVQHAHQKGIIHRDLKPSNVLVKHEDGRGVPKVIDFGVAKATAASGGLATVTRRGQLIGTPGYMSPEQAGAVVADVDTRTDVYSLGVLLYELLSGLLPYESRALRRAGDEELRRLLRETDAERPSVRLARSAVRARRMAARRGSDARGLIRALQGDLDWITMRALAKDPTERYGAASELAADIMAHLNHEPVAAGPPGLGYRLRKLAARHRVPVAGAACGLAALLMGLGSFAWQQSSSRQELVVENSLMRQAQQVASSDNARLVADVHSMAAACDAAGEAVPGQQLPYRTVFVRNAGRRALGPGDVVEIKAVATVVEGLAGRPVLDVVAARPDSGRALLGAIDGAWQLPSEGGHGHRVVAPIAPGDLGLAATFGPLVTVRVDDSQGVIRVHDALGLGAVDGLAAKSQGSGARLGIALQDWDAEGEGFILALVAPEYGQSTAGATPGTVSANWELLPRQPRAPSSWSASSSREASHDGQAPADGTRSASALLASVALAGGPAPGAPGPQGAPMSLELPEGEMATIGQAPVMPQPIPGPTPGPEVTDGSGTQDLGATGKGNPKGNMAGTGDGPGDDGGGLPAPGGLPDGGLETGDSDGADGTTTGSDERMNVEAWGDVDGDGLFDVLLGSGEGLTLLRNRGHGRFDDVTPWTGLDGSAAILEASFADLDGDGRDDLLALDERGRLHLHRSLGGGALEDMTVLAGLDRLPALESFLCFHSDGDRALDLQVVTRRGGLLLLVNDGVGRFTATVLRQPLADQGGLANDGSAATAGSRDAAPSKPSSGNRP